MCNNKREMAIKAAAFYSTDRFASVIEYCRLVDLKFTAGNYNKLQDEMLALLPPFRHPTYNELAENLIFFGRFNFRATAYQNPFFMNQLQVEKVNKDLYDAIDEYVKEAERNKIELAECKHKAQETEAVLESAKRIYQEYDGRADSKNSAVVQALGLSTGAPQKRFDYEQVYKDYFICVRKTGQSPQDAVEHIYKQHGFNSPYATIEALYKARNGVLKAWDLLCPNSSQEIKKLLKGFIRLEDNSYSSHLFLTISKFPPKQTYV